MCVLYQIFKMHNTSVMANFTCSENKGLVDLVRLAIVPITILLQTTGMILLAKVILRRRQRVQHLLFLNYSISITVISISNIVYSLLPLHDEEAICILRLWLFFMKNTVFIPGMIFINLDRLLEVLLNIKYLLYISEKRYVNAWFSGAAKWMRS